MAKRSVHKYPSARRNAPEQVPATTFKGSCLQLIERVQQTREEIVVTKHGRPVAKLVAFDADVPTIFGHLVGSITIQGDIVGPVDEAWDAEI